MKTFHCSSCGMMVYFENSHCVQCGRQLGFLPDTMTIEALDEQPDGQWCVLSNPATSQRYRQCENEKQHKICNWMVPIEDKSPFCKACRLNKLIPDLSLPGNRERWRKLEQAKKRCLYTLMHLGLPVDGSTDNRPKLSFQFLANIPGKEAISTGHENGIITVNVAEADDDERERRRLQLHEPYRTLLGHLRHELGHYYWDYLIANSPHIQSFRELFGDESVDYKVSLETYYRQGPATDWKEKTVTAYASSHPWEDWAETWAHYLHIYDTVQTANSFGLGVHGDVHSKPIDMANFDEMFKEWVPLSCALNAINRGMGLSDLYPFVIPPTAVNKLKYIHQRILEHIASPSSVAKAIKSPRPAKHSVRQTVPAI